MKVFAGGMEWTGYLVANATSFIGIGRSAAVSHMVEEGGSAGKALITVNREKGLAYQSSVLEDLKVPANTTPLPKRFGSRIPDILDGKIVGKIKSSKRICSSAQIRDIMMYADESGRKFVLYVKKVNNVSKTLTKAIRKIGGEIKTHPGS